MSTREKSITALVLTLCVLWAVAAGATTYYVDFEGGSDAADGTSPATAFKRCPGDPQAEDTRALLDACAAGYRPHQVIALGHPREGPSPVPLLQERGQVDGKATAYVCIDSVCQAPITEPEALRGRLKFGAR